MLIFFVTCFIHSILSYGIVAPAGLFVPVIVTGSSYGRFIGMLLGSHTNLSHSLYAVLGAASFLGGSMRMTVSLCVIILELTNNLLLLPLIMIVLLISKTVADAFNCSIYDLIMKVKGFPYLETHAEPYMRQLTVADVVSGPLQLFHGIEKKKAFLPTPMRLGVSDPFRHFSADDFAKRGLGNVDKIEDIELTDEEMEKFLDLHPFTNASSYTVVEMRQCH
ncbi:putative chloride channel-like protein CLC-g [Hibiscus syriacus]|uniref:Chloride channel-like protein CLC-g n=1 Tax=Hibiscus syriacus TaxID=106335 RepID=A0A6A2XQS9_HIBSY|nr:putative chloride channel-like protein CLC-g [Hibiscus syriacus]